MKIRAGFVSNSSSSSFIICSTDELSNDIVIKNLGVDESSPMFGIANMIARRISGAEELSYDQIAANVGNYETYDEMLKDGLGDEFYYPDRVWHAIVNGHHVYEMWVSSEDLYDDPIGGLLYGLDYNNQALIDTPDLFIAKSSY